MALGPYIENFAEVVIEKCLILINDYLTSIKVNQITLVSKIRIFRWEIKKMSFIKRN